MTVIHSQQQREIVVLASNPCNHSQARSITKERITLQLWQGVLLWIINQRFISSYSFHQLQFLDDTRQLSHLTYH